MKLPGMFYALGLVAIGSTLSACTCSSSDAPAPAAAEPVRIQPASETTVGAASASKKPSRFKRVEEKPPMVDRIKKVEALRLDAGVPTKKDEAPKSEPSGASR